MRFSSHTLLGRSISVCSLEELRVEAKSGHCKLVAKHKARSVLRADIDVVGRKRKYQISANANDNAVFVS